MPVGNFVESAGPETVKIQRSVFSEIRKTKRRRRRFLSNLCCPASAWLHLFEAACSDWPADYQEQEREGRRGISAKYCTEPRFVRGQKYCSAGGRPDWIVGKRVTWERYGGGRIVSAIVLPLKLNSTMIWFPFDFGFLSQPAWPIPTLEQILIFANFFLGVPAPVEWL